jgi:hypothetical protein
MKKNSKWLIVGLALLTSITLVAVWSYSNLKTRPDSQKEIVWETYRPPLYIGFRIKYPKSELKNNIQEKTEYVPQEGASQDENLKLWQSVIELKESTITISRQHNFNPVTGQNYESIEEFEVKAIGYTPIIIGGYNGKDSKEYSSSNLGITRDIILFKDNYVWTLQEIKPSKNSESYLDKIVASFEFL